ncbi:MAG: sulfatase [Planctomycetota bacterium]
MNDAPHADLFQRLLARLAKPCRVAPAVAFAAMLASLSAQREPAAAPVAALAAEAADRGGARARPNLLFVLTDDQRFDQMGCAGHPVLKTPTMDRLAAEGVRFANAYVTTAICAASRASILTGRREGHHGYTFGTPPMGRELAESSYAQVLRQDGYRTGFVGKWGMRFEKGVAKDAFDWRKPMGYPYRRPGKPHLTDRIAAAAIDFMQQEDERPFCLSISFHAPHADDGSKEQYYPALDLAELYADADVAVPPLAESGFAALPPFLQTSLGRERWGWRFDSREKQVRRTKDYWRMITGIDRALGTITAALEASGQADNTVILFTSDNGYFLGERGLAGKWLIYEESIRVPLLVYDPRAPQSQRGRVVDAMALNIDFAPTLLELAGCDAVPAGYDGRSLVPLLAGDAPADWRTDFLYEHLFNHKKIPPSVGVRGERFVYARYERQQPVYEQLFDLKADPEQLRNLSDDAAFAEELARMRARCSALQKL